MLFHSLLSCKVSAEKSAVSFPLNVTWHFVLAVYYGLCWGSFLVLSIWGPIGLLYLDVHIFSRTGNVFSYWFIKMVSYAFSLLFTLMSHKFWRLPSFLCLLFFTSAFKFRCSSAQCSLLLKLSAISFIWLIEFFTFKICLIHFQYLCWISHSYHDQFF
jgi:hypothetical protein